MIDFPANPTVGQQFTAAGVTWVWDAAKWTPAGATAALVPAMNDNRIINGDMRIDQRNNGATSMASAYTVDRWQYSGAQASKVNWGRNLGVPAQPAGFGYYFGCISQSAYASLASDYFLLFQPVEADMVTDFAWGSANAQPVTLSFLASCSLTGTFSGSVRNAAGTRSYPFSYSLPTANTFAKIIVTIPGDTAGTWVMSGNAAALSVGFDLGCGSTFRGPANAWAGSNFMGATGAVSVVGTNGANFCVTGVKLEIGSVATPFNRQSLAKSLADCQRYYQTISGIMLANGYNTAGAVALGSLPFPVQMRGTPTVAYSGMTYGNASAIGTNAISAIGVSPQVTVTATGLGWGAGTAALSAEL